MTAIRISQSRGAFILTRAVMSIIGLVVAGVVLLGTINPVAAKPQFSAIAVDARTGKILFGSSIDAPRHPASLTKVMTLYLLFQDLKAGRIKLTTDLKVSRRAASMQPSKLGLKGNRRVVSQSNRCAPSGIIRPY